MAAGTPVVTYATVSAPTSFKSGLHCPVDIYDADNRLLLRRGNIIASEAQTRAADLRRHVLG